MKQLYGYALFSGLLFGLGLSLSQMVNPNKVINFLDLTGQWDPSLLMVMMGALPIALFCFRFILKRPASVLNGDFQLPTKKEIDKPLIAGAAIFGVGWGISGYCPGTALASLGQLSLEGLVMGAGIYAGFFAFRHFFESV